MYFKCIDNTGHKRARGMLNINSIYEGYYFNTYTVHLTITGDYGWLPERFIEVTKEIRDKKLDRVL